jgi:aldose sugar dehydrogenase
MMRDRALTRRGFIASGAAIATAFSARGALAAETFPAAAGPLRLVTLVQDIENPWSFAFMPDGRLLINERPGRMRIAADGKLSQPVSGLPEIEQGGQGGLLDVVLDPEFSTNRTIYWSYSEPRQRGNGTAIARGTLESGATPRVNNVEVIFRQMPDFRSRNHFGCRIVFDRSGHLFATLGDRYGGRDMAQTLDNHLGKVIRIARDGSAPKDNPFIGRNGAKPEIWSYGHRNPQGAALHPDTGALWTVEHGARGGDEVNIPQAGKNYGWPIITYGRDYSGAAIGEGTEKSGMKQPVHYWDPSIAPSGMAFYTGDAVPAWKGSLFIGALAGMMLVRLTINDNRITGEERLFENLNERIRDVRQGPDGALYIATDNADGRILKIEKA